MEMIGLVASSHLGLGGLERSLFELAAFGSNSKIQELDSSII